jgi:hypothetical protein
MCSRVRVASGSATIGTTDEICERYGGLGERREARGCVDDQDLGGDAGEPIDPPGRNRWQYEHPRGLASIETPDESSLASKHPTRMAGHRACFSNV